MEQPNPRNASRLRFTNEELQTDGLKTPDRKAKQKAIQAKKRKKPKGKNDAAKHEAKPHTGSPGKKADEKPKAAPTAKAQPAAAENKPVSSRLHFGEMPGTKKKGSPVQEKRGSGISVQPVKRVVKSEVDYQLYQHEEDNTGLQAAHASQQAGSSALHTGKQLHEIRQNRLKHAGEEKQKTAAFKLDDAKKGAHAEKGMADLGGSNPMSKQYQRTGIKKEYRASKAGKKSGKAAGKATRGAAEKASSISEKAVEYVSKKKHYIVIILLGLLLLLITQGIAACAPLLQAGVVSVTSGSYPAEEDDIRAAERYYSGLERDLQDELDNYAYYHPEVDEYTIDAQEIWHEPYALIALISAYNNGEQWTIDDAIPIMDMLFRWQYERDDATVTTMKYYTEIVNGKEEKIWHPVTSCTVTLKNKNLSHAPVYIMSSDKVGLYALYMSTHGNMDGLFHGAHVSELKDPLVYDVPQELLDADPKFALLVEEANKRLGYPYVWGGHTPETSFDCSGFISWIFTETGVRNIGHMGATGLYSISRKITEAELKPGDVIYFSGTIEGESGITHCGLYVGNGMMIHCGSPCTYYDIAHGSLRNNIAGYGRLYEH